jgi:choline transporter-like protein 2/4/5
MLFIGKLLVGLGAGALTWAFFAGTFTLDESWLQAINVDPSSVNSVWLPTLLVTVGAYVIAVGFFNVYSMAVSTVFLCFLEDLERNDGSESKPYFMSKSLMDLMGKKNKKNKNVAETKSM